MKLEPVPERPRSRMISIPTSEKFTCLAARFSTKLRFLEQIHFLNIYICTILLCVLNVFLLNFNSSFQKKKKQGRERRETSTAPKGGGGKTTPPKMRRRVRQPKRRRTAAPLAWCCLLFPLCGGASPPLALWVGAVFSTSFLVQYVLDLVIESNYFKQLT